MRKCRVIILILSLDIILMCDAVKEYDCRNKINSSEKIKLSNKPVKTQKLNIEGERFLSIHNPITCDGYILTTFRLNFIHNKPTRSPVLLAPGMFQSSDRFLHQTVEKSLAYKLQDLGYDVWLFNARGNKYCRKHVKLSSECDGKNEFFDYTFEEIGLLDVAATVDYILSATMFQKIQYIGHSFGATYFLVLNSLRPDYNDLFDRAFLLAPFAYQRKFPYAALKKDFKHFNVEELIEDEIVEIFPYKCIGSEEYKFPPEECLGRKKGYETICNSINIQNVMGLNSDQNNKFDSRGGSIKQLAHFKQNVRSGRFRRYQYRDANDNTKNYGAKTSPEYNLGHITVPTTIYYSMTDEYVNHKDVQELADKLGNATTVKVAKSNFKHDDFVNSTDAMFYVYTGIIRALPEHPGPKRADNMETCTHTTNNSVIVGASLCICLCTFIINWVTSR